MVSMEKGTGTFNCTQLNVPVPFSIDTIDLHALRMPLVGDFATSFGRVAHREMVIVAVAADGITGWGEAPVAARPHYSAETTQSAMHVLADHLAPAVLKKPLTTIDDLFPHIAFVRGNPMAKAALEWAVRDLLCQIRGVSLAASLGAVREHVPVGVSLGIPQGGDIAALLADVEARVACGYRRVKLKIRPDFCAKPVSAVRERFPELLLCADGNGGFGWQDLAELLALDHCDLMFVEQPFGPDDLVEHARLRRRLKTPLCLDESLEGPEALASALALGALDIVNLKPGRVGGAARALSMVQSCCERQIPLWCGGMLETGIGRAACVALAACAGFTLPADLSATARYYAHDIATPPFELGADSTLAVPQRPGLGVDVDLERLRAVTSAHRQIS